MDHLANAVEEARSVAADVPVVALLTFGEDVALADGMAPGLAAHALAQRVDVDVLGVNCGAGPTPERLEVAASSKRGLAAIDGTCWSAAILPKPMMAILSGRIRP